MISESVVNNLKKASWIRAMFEEGEKLRKIHGADNVYDFTLGNPDHEPPASVKEALKDIVTEDKPGIHRYMNNAGYEDVRQKVADHLNKTSGLSSVSSQHIIMTCGAAGALNVVLKTILNPGEEVIILAPYFAEYIFYVGNHGGKVAIVPPEKDSFKPDLKILESSITAKTKAIIINSPNNPSGYIYSEETLKEMSAILEKKEKEYNTTIYAISDEPYYKLVYDNVKLPFLFKLFKKSFIVNSFSKSLALPGERIGYIAVNPEIPELDLILESLVFCNRTLGYVNAPALFQKVIAGSLDEDIDIESYKQRRDIIFDNLTRLGFSCIKPQGTFYIFPKSPIEDDIQFIKHAVKYNLLLVPGTGFGLPGHFRISYCVSMDTIKKSIPAFEALAKDFNLIK
ncbi:pyridoxal phosphate-dependent aminotransferase [Acetivibrio straminisolvens]|jgi:aspartate aminotransferase|uniref:Aminotransferase n=1 Tax=Acetivibrio straminisolvens JCM 21531 TaxID=1294263 RepID=W4V2A1_9FIRM|nr:pyridoxal phosphate-dependent aminotransferase [Acetivibrio straminisolvens]GAE86859.1 biosynthetic Aromatic amino acid aminotransferase alpha [Acetivibrio straminisolvens JCM 21531]